MKIPVNMITDDFNMNNNAFIEEAFTELFPERDFFYDADLKYSGRFKALNGQIKLSGRKLTIKLGRLWEDVSPDIRKGIIQHLLKRLFKYKGAETLSMELYESFAKQMSEDAPVTQSDPILDEAFYRVNSKYFDSLLEKPNLKWGSRSTSKLAGYDYTTDTVSVSTIFKSGDIPREWVDYLVYHELLHKKLKYHRSGGKTYHHTSEFKHLEEQFEDFHKIDKDIKIFVKALPGRIKKRKKRGFFDYFL
ncbi:hypothetical protein K9M79_04455 [Candidatus Woesearchaeota archaeon]|nr:hypothetical protein [Candidatus Woesearchaeota archaeon]